MQPLRKHIHVVKTGAPAAPPADSVEKVRHDAEVLALRLKALSKKEVLGPPIRTVDIEDRKSAAKIDKQIKRLIELADLKRDLQTEENVIKSDLKQILVDFKASAIEAPTGRYCAQPGEACIVVREASIAYVPRV